MVCSRYWPWLKLGVTMVILGNDIATQFESDQSPGGLRRRGRVGEGGEDDRWGGKIERRGQGFVGPLAQRQTPQAGGQLAFPAADRNQQQVLDPADPCNRVREMLESLPHVRH